MSDAFPSIAVTTSTTSGTGALVLNIADRTDYLRTPKRAVTQGSLTDGDGVFYHVIDKQVTDGIPTFEVGYGTYDDTANTISRTAGNVIDGSNGPGVLVSLPGSGTRDVLILDHIAVMGALISASNSFRIGTNGNIGIGEEAPNSNAKVHINLGTGAPYSLTAETGLLIQNDQVTTDFSLLHLICGATGNAQLLFGSAAASGEYGGRVRYDPATDDMRFYTNANERVRIDSTGQVGIGETSPAAMLDVDGSALFNSGAGDNDFEIKKQTSGTLLFGDVSTGRVGIGDSSPDTTLQVGSDVSIGSMPTAANTPQMYIAESVNDTTAAANPGVLIGRIQANSAGGVLPLEAYAITNHSSGTMTLSAALVGNNEHRGAGTLSIMRGIAATVFPASGAGPITRLVGGFLLTQNFNASNAVTNMIGLEIDNGGTGGITNAYGVYINTLTGTTKYGIFNEGEDDHNHFAGAIRMPERSNNPPTPTVDAEGIFYVKANRVIFKWNDGGTVRYKYMLLSGTGTTWTHTTTAP